MTTFSIIIATYNQEKDLKDCLDSLVEQSDKDFDVHVCDDGSNYDIKSLVDKYLDKLTIYLHIQEHKGMRLAKNWNQGIRKARGQYCITISGDMQLDPLYLEQLSYAVSPTSIICTFRINRDDLGQVLSYDWRFGKQPDELEDVIKPVDENAPWTSLTGNGMCVPTRFYRETNGWDERYEGYGRDDWSMILKAHRAGFKFFTLTKAVYYHHGESNTPDDPKNLELFEKELHEN